MEKSEETCRPEACMSDEVLTALRKIIQSIDLNSKSLERRIGLTGPQLYVLKVVSDSDVVSVGKIAKIVSLSQGTVTGILERLEKRQLIIRKKDAQDRRRVLVTITDPGKSLIKNAPPLMQEAFVEQFERFRDWEQTMILSALQRLVSIMDVRHGEVGPVLLAGPIIEASVERDSDD